MYIREQLMYLLGVGTDDILRRRNPERAYFSTLSDLNPTAEAMACADGSGPNVLRMRSLREGATRGDSMPIDGSRSVDLL